MVFYFMLFLSFYWLVYFILGSEIVLGFVLVDVGSVTYIFSGEVFEDDLELRGLL